MSNVSSLRANNNLSNIPHMLRNLADELESGSEPMPQAVMCIAVYQANEAPVLFHFGNEIGRLTEIGALHAVLQVASQMVPEE